LYIKLKCPKCGREIKLKNRTAFGDDADIVYKGKCYNCYAELELKIREVR